LGNIPLQSKFLNTISVVNRLIENRYLSYNDKLLEILFNLIGIYALHKINYEIFASSQFYETLSRSSNPSRFNLISQTKQEEKYC